MISETAIEELEDLRAAGLKPTDRDVVRLNALGLKLEAAHKKRPLDSTMYLPRVAVISDTVSFRQPTIGHEIWLERVRRVICCTDYDTLLALKAFCLSRPYTELPDPDDPSSVTKALAHYAEALAPFTSDQVYAAICYAVEGADPKRGEYARAPDREPDGSEVEDWDYCVAVGVLHEGALALYGCSLAELKAMTQQQLRDLIDRSFFYHNIRIERTDVEDAQRNFYLTRDEIKARLEAERK